MKIYAIRDRMVGYYMTPFAAASDSQVLAAVATQVNAGDNHGISQAPHHFEVWSLADIDEETGKVTARSEFICDCSTLVRRSLRKGEGFDGAGDETGSRPRPPRGIGADSNTEAGPSEGQAAGGPRKAPEANPGPERSN